MAGSVKSFGMRGGRWSEVCVWGGDQYLQEVNVKIQLSINVLREYTAVTHQTEWRSPLFLSQSGPQTIRTCDLIHGIP